jgi:hypothetical protein
MGRAFVGWKCKGPGPCKRNFVASEHVFICHNHNYGGGEFCDDCARKINYKCYICGNYIG